MAQKHVILVAGGRGLRFGGETPKQLLLLGGKPLLAYAMERFYAYDSSIHIVLVLPEEALAQWRGGAIPHTLAVGGRTRFHSVQSALRVVGGEGLVAVHDGVRPLVSVATIAACFEEAERSGAAIPVVPLADSVRRRSPGGGSAAVDRGEFCAVQTPQVFRAAVLHHAYEQPFCTAFTDDASVVEQAGYRVALVPGNAENIKVTSPVDLVAVAAMLEARAAAGARECSAATGLRNQNN
ncbi:MAG: 2-C-methyl-D-erythritol 4-phosphate cytidylyltransferase [Prevotellaceae bacterium]|nr:2-C-methyl-D-erythritol 4-phosphate cytidylyltransferase [Prevotellaceae bacterium]